jgi:hypothetical protein
LEAVLSVVAYSSSKNSGLASIEEAICFGHAFEVG